MIHYLILAADGSIKQRGACQYEVDLPKPKNGTVELIDSTDPRMPPPVEKVTYQDFRRMDYPAFGDQLDAIWDILDAAGLITDKSKAKAVIDRVKAVKAQYPKK